MIVKTTESVTAISQLLQIPSFLKYTEMLKNSMKKTQHDLINNTLTDREQHVCIGELRILVDLLDTIDNARGGSAATPKSSYPPNPLSYI